jgi:ATP-dependent Clp protease protease subunit
MHQPHTGGGVFQGQATDVQIWAEDFAKSRRKLAELTAFHTGQPLEKILVDSERDRWYSPEEALEYGFIDAVIERSSLNPGL